jgi:hypothetical protein
VEQPGADPIDIELGDVGPVPAVGILVANQLEFQNDRRDFTQVVSNDRATAIGFDIRFLLVEVDPVGDGAPAQTTFLTDRLVDGLARVGRPTERLRLHGFLAVPAGWPLRTI